MNYIVPISTSKYHFFFKFEDNIKGETFDLNR